MADNQYGFRKGRSTLDVINLAVSTAKKATAGTKWKGESKKHFLDIKHALNLAKRNSIMRNIKAKKIAVYLRQIVNMTRRTVQKITILPEVFRTALFPDNFCGISCATGYSD